MRCQEDLPYGWITTSPRLPRRSRSGRSQSLNETIKLALRDEVAQRKKGPESRRSRQTIEEDRELLERLAK
ncbi:MAG: hypothetical protein ABI949_00050 [Ilumatobacteraceae bacterium]